MKDPYEVLGVAKTATADEIKQAYRKLARELHPDVNPGNKRAEERFKEASAAYDFLSDADKRGQYDRGEIDATGAPRRRTWRGHAGGGRGARSGFAFGEDVDDILAEMMRRKARARGHHWTDDPEEAPRAQRQQRGADSRHPVTVSFVEAALGCSKRIALVTGKEIDIRIPPATTDGQTLRLKGQGHPGSPAGDAFVDIKVEPHPYFNRRDRDVLVEVPVSVQEAVLGGKITVPTIDGKVAVTVPAGSNTGTVLRLKGKGIPTPAARGDQLITLKVMLPENDPDFRKLVEKWGARAGYDPRAKAGMA
ncbi:MAG: DnaJ C-terminal domain-containing protein [Pseudomonadota bacterium]